MSVLRFSVFSESLRMPYKRRQILNGWFHRVFDRKASIGFSGVHSGNGDCPEFIWGIVQTRQQQHRIVNTENRPGVIETTLTMPCGIGQRI